MKLAKAAWMAMVLLLAAAASGPVLAHGRGHVHFGVFVGGPGFWYYPPPYYYYPPYYPPTVIVPASPPTYIEQGSSQAAPDRSAYWYYCAGSKSYYPYVKECPGGWQHVVPHPPGS